MITLKQAPLTNEVCSLPPPVEYIHIYMFTLAAAVAVAVGSSISQFLQEFNLFALLVHIPANPCDLQPVEGSSSYSE